MQIEIKINGEAAELQDVLRALLNSSTAQATEVQPKPKSRKAGEVIKVEEPNYATGGELKGTQVVTVEGPNKILTPEQVKEVAALQEAEKPEITADEPQTTISFEQVRAAIGAAALKNKDAVKLLLKEFGATKTSELDPKHYETIMQDLTRI